MTDDKRDPSYCEIYCQSTVLTRCAGGCGDARCQIHWTHMIAKGHKWPWCGDDECKAVIVLRAMDLKPGSWTTKG